MPEDDDCEQAVHALHLFLDGELTVERRAAIQVHLDGCPPCFEAFDFEAELRQVVAQRCREQVPEPLKLRILAALSQTDVPDVTRGSAGPAE